MERDVNDALENAAKANGQRIATSNAEWLYSYYSQLKRVGFSENQALYFINRAHDAWLAAYYPTRTNP